MNIKMSTEIALVIDGREFNGNNVSICNGKVTVDGVVLEWRAYRPGHGCRSWRCRVAGRIMLEM